MPIDHCRQNGILFRKACRPTDQKHWENKHPRNIQCISFYYKSQYDHR